MRAVLHLAVFAPGALALDGAQAAPTFTTTYSFCSVSGANTTAIYASLLQRSLRVNGRRHHALTEIGFARPRVARSAKSCVVELSVRFLVSLPRLDSEASLSAKVRRLWRQFSTFISRHEERHRAIWMSCTRAIEAKLRSWGCEESQLRSIVEQTTAACRNKDAAFDAIEQARVSGHPFIRSAAAPIYARPRRVKKKRHCESPLSPRSKHVLPIVSPKRGWEESFPTTHHALKAQKEGCTRLPAKGDR